jgi:hypothetical protein
MRTITLELLRHGPAHNQLLSPLTPYLALCENHAPVTVNLPFEHNQFLHRLTALTYEFGDSRIADDQRKFQLQDTGRELSRILSLIPGLTAELNRHREESNEVIHLRLILSASELALIPFEVVLAGNGHPGFGQPLLLQNQAPICLTRETRRVKDTQFQWTSHAKVLFVCASPAGLAPVPADAHLLALRRAVAPWIRYYPDDDDEARRSRVEECLHVLQDATVEDIQDVCAKNEYTHVHILAHGVTRPDGFDLRFGLALFSSESQGATDVVSGDRLASALRPLLKPSRSGFARPVVVTLASCNAANQGSVVGAGASIAHALQSAGIPLVLAGQFPLSFAGSVELVETLYDGLLWGADPRALLMDLRRRMHVLYPNRHDWAALTAYATLSADFDEQLEKLQVGRAQLALSAAMDYADKVLFDSTGAHVKQGSDVSTRSRVREQVPHALARIEQPWERMQQLSATIPAERVDLRGLLASLAKRRAEVVLLGGGLVDDSSTYDAAIIQACRNLLDYSRRLYGDCFDADRNALWACVQQIGLTLLLRTPDSQEKRFQSVIQSRQLLELWRTSYFQSLIDSRESTPRAGWALGNLVELPLLAVLLGIEPMSTAAGTELDGANAELWFLESERYVEELVRRAPEFEFQDYSSYRQLQHYVHWFPIVNPAFEVVTPLAMRLLAKMPSPQRSNEF